MKLDELKSLCEEATPGPWRWSQQIGVYEADEIGVYIPYTDGSKGRGSWKAIIKTDSRVYPPSDADASFIIAAREMLPKLIKVAEAAKAACKDLPARYDDAGILSALRHALKKLES